jgi:hypothetical protein
MGSTPIRFVYNIPFLFGQKKKKCAVASSMIMREPTLDDNYIFEHV